MYYLTVIKDHIRLAPRLFGVELKDALLQMIKEKYDGFISRDFGVVIDVTKIQDIAEGVIIPGDGAAFYETTFEVVNFKPEMHEVLMGKVRDIAEFGLFLNMGAMEGMVYISQAMDDYVSYSKEKTISGKDSKKMLKVGDDCRSRVIAVSFKDIANPKLGLTMRQPGLGKLEWLEVSQKVEKSDKKEEK